MVTYAVHFDTDGLPAECEFVGDEPRNDHPAPRIRFVQTDTPELHILRDGEAVSVTQEELDAARIAAKVRGERIRELYAIADQKARDMGYIDFGDLERTLNPVAQAAAPEWYEEAAALVRWRYEREREILENKTQEVEP